jgi:hypothetical protein
MAMSVQSSGRGGEFHERMPHGAASGRPCRSSPRKRSPKYSEGPPFSCLLASSLAGSLHARPADDGNLSLAD